MNKSIRTALATTAAVAIITTAGITALVYVTDTSAPETERVAATPPPDSLLGIYGSEDAIHDTINAGLAADAWTPAAAPASTFDYEVSTGSLRDLWDMSTQGSRDALCADRFSFYTDGDTWDLKAVADFDAQVCAP